MTDMPESVYLYIGKENDIEIMPSSTMKPVHKDWTLYIRANPAVEWQTIDTFDEQNESCVLVTNGQGTWAARWTYGADGDGFYEIDTHYGRINGVTYYMPFPLPPKGA